VNRRRVFWVLLVTVLLMSAPILFAQTGIPSGGTGDAGNGFNGAGPSDLLNGYYQASNSWITSLQTIAIQLFWALALIDLTWTCITLVLQHSDLQPWMAGFIRKIITIGFFATLLTQGPAWTSAIVNFFIALGVTAGGNSVTAMSPSNIMGQGVELAVSMLGAAAASGNPGTGIGGVVNAINIMAGGIANIAPQMILVLGALLIVIAYVVVALHFVMAMVEAYVVIGAGYIFLGFGGSRWTVPYVEKYLGMVVSAGVRLMVLELIIGLGYQMLPKWQATATNVSQIVQQTGGAGWTGVQAEFGLMASIGIFALLCWTIPQIASNVASGSLSMSGGDALAAGAAAGSAAFAGASFGTSSSPSNSGNQSDLASVAQAAGLRGAEMGVQTAMAIASGGASAAASGLSSAASMAGGTASGVEMVGALTPSPPPPVPGDGGSGFADSAGMQVEPPNGGKAEAASSSGSDAKRPGSESSSNAGSGRGVAADASGVSDTSSTSNGGNAPEDAKAAAAAQGSDARVDRAATAANEAPAIDQAIGNSQDATRNAGQAARVEAIAKGASPQQAVEADRLARAQAGRGLGSRLAQGARELEGALNRMPDDGGRMGGTTPNVGHGE